MNIDLNEFVDQDMGVLDPSGIESRIEELKQFREEAEEESGSWEPEAAEELRELLQFRTEVQRVTGQQFWEASLVPDVWLHQHIKHYALSEHGLEDAELARFIDWPAYVEAQQKNSWVSVPLGEQVMWAQVPF